MEFVSPSYHGRFVLAPQTEETKFKTLLTILNPFKKRTGDTAVGEEEAGLGRGGGRLFDPLEKCVGVKLRGGREEGREGGREGGKDRGKEGQREGQREEERERE